MNFFQTRSRLMEHLSEKGVKGAAAEFIAKSQASQRHEWRVSEAIRVAKEADPVRWRGLLVLDRIGLGNGTARVPALRVLGKGRKHASDGAAWSAAIRDAALSDGVSIPTIMACDRLADDGGPVLKMTWDVYLLSDERTGYYHSQTLSPAIAFSTKDTALLPWLLVAAEEGLKGCLDAPLPTEDDRCRRPLARLLRSKAADDADLPASEPLTIPGDPRWSEVSLERSEDWEGGISVADLYVGEPNARTDELRDWAALYNAIHAAIESAVK